MATTAKELWMVYFINGVKYVVGQKLISKENGGIAFNNADHAHYAANSWKSSWDKNFYLVTTFPERVPEEKPARWGWGYRPPTPKKQQNNQ